MTEMLRVNGEDSPEYQPSDEAQTEFFRAVMVEGAGIGHRPRLVIGPHYKGFEAIMRQSNEAIRAVDQNLTPEYTMPLGYVSPEVKAKICAMSDNTRKELFSIRNQRIALLDSFAHEQIEPVLKNQILPKGILDTPPYRSQGYSTTNIDMQNGCMNACFRMVFEAITGWQPSQEIITQQLHMHHGSSVVHDNVYSAIYATPTFKEVCRSEVITIELIGADLEMIGNIAKKVKQKNSQAKVFCMVNLSSESAIESVWHACILTDAGGCITVHDPAEHKGKENRLLLVKDFTERWARTYNRAVLTIAA